MDRRHSVCVSVSLTSQDGPYITLLYWGDIMYSWKRGELGLQIDPSVPSKVIDRIISLFKHHVYFVSDWFSINVALLEKLMELDSLEQLYLLK